MTYLTLDCLPARVLVQSIVPERGSWGVEHLEVRRGSQSDNQMIGFSLLIIFNNVLKEGTF